MRRFAGRALAVFATVMLFSDWTMAQQTGLFPLAPIRRQRPRCDQQDPVYRLYKDQYFGYHPTLWRRFPSGWGAPSPEAPDAAKSFEAIPLVNLDGEKVEDLLKRQQEGQDQGEDMQGRDIQGPDLQGQPADDQPRLPQPPAEDNRSPFEMDFPAAAPNGNDNGNGAQPPAGREPSPFEGLDPRAEAPRSPRPAASESAQPTVTTTRSSRRRRAAEIDPADAGSPLLSAAEDLNLIDAADPALRNVSGAAPAEAGDHGHDHQHRPAARRSLFGTMLGNLGWNVRR